MDNADIQELARLIDTALASDNPSVKKALRNFMLIVSIVDSENTESTIKGPFSELFQTINGLTRRIEILERNNNSNVYRGTSTNPYTIPTWVSTNGNYITNNVNPVTTSSYSSASNTVSLADLDLEMTTILKNVNAT
jgi:negative regulator of replication initiation